MSSGYQGQRGGSQGGGGGSRRWSRRFARPRRRRSRRFAGRRSSCRRISRRRPLPKKSNAANCKKTSSRSSVRRGRQRRSPVQLCGDGRGRQRQRQGRLGLRQGERSAAERREGREGRDASADRSGPRRPDDSAPGEGALRRRQGGAGPGVARYRRDRRRRGAPCAKRPASTTSSPRASVRTIRCRWSRRRWRLLEQLRPKIDVERLRGVHLS